MTLTKELYDELRQSILRGELGPGTRLPSTRALAEERGLSRNTVLNAYEQLLAEGYVEARVGSGTCVARALPEELLTVGASGAQSARQAAHRDPLSQRGALLSSNPGRPLAVPHRPRPFDSGLPDASAFPFKTWTRLMARQWRRPAYELLSYGEPAGYRPLREAIAAYVRTARAVRCEAEQVFIVSGSQQALDLTARLLIDPGDVALIEDPGYPGARVALSAAGASIVPLPVDGDGADIARCTARARRARLLFVTPSHQYPLGVTLTLTRRLALLEWAKRTGAWIVEDDYDSEFRYRKKPLPSLQGLDATGRVIYLGTFSKTLFPSLRLGFVVLPSELVEPFRRARAVVDGHSPVSEQAVLAEFIAAGHFARHIRRMRVLYQERQSVLVEAARRELGGLLDVRPADGGMHLVGWLPDGVDDVAVSDHAASCGVHVFPLSRCAIGNAPRRGVLLGYAALSAPQIREGVRKLARALGEVAGWRGCEVSRFRGFEALALIGRSWRSASQPRNLATSQPRNLETSKPPRSSDQPARDHRITRPSLTSPLGQAISSSPGAGELRPMRMMTIPSLSWRRSLDTVSRTLNGAIVSVEIDCPDMGRHSEVTSQPLGGITADRNGIVVQVARGNDHLDHTVADVQEVRFEETAEGALRTVELDSRDGTRTFVRFRSPVIDALLDPAVE